MSTQKDIGSVNVTLIVTCMPCTDFSLLPLPWTFLPHLRPNEDLNWLYHYMKRGHKERMG